MKPHQTKFLNASLLILIAVFITLFSCDKKEEEPENTAPQSWGIIVYGVADCIYCSDFEQELDDENIAYTFYDINVDGVKRLEMLDKLAAAGIPNSSIKWPVVDVITDGVSHIFIRPSLEKDVKPLIGL